MESSVKFINYTGHYPALCLGDLTLEINGKIYEFGTNKVHPIFWSSGGSCYFTNNYEESHITQDEWMIDKDFLPDELKKYSKEIKRVLNESIRWGCCGGCL